MAWTSVGFDGTITEIQWAGLAGLLGNGYVAAGNGDCAVTAVSGARSVSVAAGSLYGDGVLSTNSGAETVAMTTPVNGQWYVIALRRTWATNTAALVAIAGATTTTTTPTAAPTSFPTMNTNVGVLTDQPIAWAWCNSANTTVVVFDIRLKAVKSLPPVVATSAERDAKFMSPTQGLQVWRDDLGAVETYYGLYNLSTNPGGRASAGWYTNDRQTGLIPIRPTSATIASGTGSDNGMGTISFSNATAVSLNGVFTSAYTNYRIVMRLTTTASVNLNVRMRSAGTDQNSGTNYNNNGYTAYSGGFSNYPTAGQSNWTIGALASAGMGNGSAVIDIFAPAIAEYTTIISNTQGGDGSVGNRAYSANGIHYVGSSYDGFTLFIGSGTMNGTFTVYGYNS